VGTQDPRIDAYIAKSADFARPILSHLRKLIHAGCPEVQETMKWSFPHFEYQGVLCSMAAFKAHATFGFWKSGLMKTLAGHGKGDDAMGHYGRVTSLDDLPSEKAIIAQVKEAARLNAGGIKVPKTKTKKPPLKVPTYFQAALKKNAKARATFENFSPSHKREYIEWITEAKTDATRQKRLATTLEWLAEGKSLNWKYETH
jgi:uncharacterized protein YdeI (YjbR/CyaY-like superfamily)